MANWNDGGLPRGARKIQVYPPSGVDANGNTTWGATPKGIYSLSNWQPVRGGRVTKRYDEVAQPNGAYGVDDFVESTALVQLANITSILVNTGDAFTTNRAISTTGGAVIAESFVITEVGEAEEQNGIKFQQVRLQKLVVATGPTLY